MDEISGCAQQSLFPWFNRWLGKKCLVDLINTNYYSKTVLYNERVCVQFIYACVLYLCVYTAYAHDVGIGITQVQAEEV